MLQRYLEGVQKFCIPNHKNEQTQVFSVIIHIFHWVCGVFAYQYNIFADVNKKRRVMISNTYKKYLWLLNTLLRYKKLTYAEIRDKWMSSSLNDGTELSLRTFHDHRKAVQQLFDVEVMCDKANGYKYYIEGHDSLEQDYARKWLINSFNVSNMVSEGKSLKNRIILEDIPQGTEFLQLVIEAMKEERELEVDYHPFMGKCGVLHIQPYTLKMYNRRWYILGYMKEENGIRHLALDRIEELNITKQTFKIPHDFNAESYYNDSVGIFVNENLKPKKVRIRAFKPYDSYIKSLPLHHSQVEIKDDNKDYADFKLDVCLTPDLTSQLLAMGDKVEVLEPKELREDIKDVLNKAFKRY